ncbi:hypothetical protein [Armatimonas sp.]|uniref:hypothetical protein n=1 Tax=Armatimonas sp. TaxID=1872638 RepID=UPI00286AFB9C|nr:hypothetical protein [Armatimonas sp.]
MIPLIPAFICSAAQPAEGTLSEVLGRLYWNVAARGPLLIVAPECQTPPLKPDSLPPDLFGFTQGDLGEEEEEESAPTPTHTPLPPLPPGPLNPALILPRYGLRLVRLTGLTVVEHERMMVSNVASFTKTQQEGFASPHNTLLVLLASLTDNQWRALGSAQGLGENQLTDAAQKKLFKLLLPPTLTLRFDSEPGLPPTNGEDSPLRLPPAALANPRLRLTRSLSLTAFPQGSPNESFPLSDQAEPKRAKPEWERNALLSSEKYVPDEMFSSTAVAPSRPRPTQLDPASPLLDAPISLEGAQTVGQLVTRLARATRLSLLCDARIAKRSVVVRGRGPVRAGTVLAALCRGVQGAVRKLDSTYLLTQQLTTGRELQEAEQLALQSQDKLLDELLQNESAAALWARRELIASRATDKVSRDRQSPLPEALWALGSKFVPPLTGDFETRPDPASLALSGQPAFLREQAQKSYQERLTAAREAGEPLPKAPDRLSAETMLQLSVHFPALGAHSELVEFRQNLLHPDTPFPEPPAPASWASLATRAWFVPLPATPDERETLLSLAKRCGVSELRVSLPPGEEPEKLFTALAAQAKLSGVKVLATLCPFEALTPATKRDVDVLGRTASAWSAAPVGKLARTSFRDFGEPESLDLKAFIAWCQRLSALPGVSGFTLTELAPPGYTESLGSWEGGGQWRERLAFLQKESLDAADFISSQDSPTAEQETRWLQRKIARRDAFLTRLNDALKAANLLRGLSAQSLWGWERWRPGMIREAESSEGESTVTAEARPALLNLPLEETPWRLGDDSPRVFLDETGQLRLWLNESFERLRKQQLYEGIVLDISKFPLGEGLKLLESAFLNGAKK